MNAAEKQDSSVDFRFLNEILVNDQAKGKLVIKKVVGIFFNQSSLFLKQIQNNLKIRDTGELASVAHKFRSNASSVGAIKLMKLLEKFEFDGAQVLKEDWTQSVKSVEDELSVVKEQLKNFIAHFN
ncbi:MAG: Hpt domain-containing protein [Deltaproteobacteria bacterium]|nr:Hpt domain-containing protein [Deltaproteobacteria bacterium]